MPSAYCRAAARVARGEDAVKIRSIGTVYAADDESVRSHFHPQAGNP